MTDPFPPHILSIKADKISNPATAGLKYGCFGVGNSRGRQDVAAGGAKNNEGGIFLNTMMDVCSNRHEKSRLRHVNFIHIQLDPESYADMNAEAAEHHHLMFCNLGKGRDK